MDTKTVNIDMDIFKDMKILCAKYDMKIRDFVNDSIKKEINNYDNNEKDKSEVEKK